MSRARTGDLSSLREANRLRVLRELRSAGPTPQADLARKTGLSPASISNIVTDAVAAGLVTVTDAVRGRRVKLVSLSRTLGLGAGIAVDHRHLTVVVGDLSAELLHTSTAPIEVGADPAAVLEAAARLTEEGVAAAAGPGERLVAVGLTVPAPVPPRGEAGTASAPGWWQMLPAEWLTARFGVPASIDNEANAAALAEWRWGAGRDCREVLYVQVGDGIGAGLILGGEMYRGSQGWAGELGHLVMVPNGPLCRCGNRGCLETIAAAPAIVATAREGCPQVTSLADTIDRALAGDAACRAALAKAASAVGAAIATAVTLLNPQRVVIGGLVMPAADIVLPVLRAAFEQAALPSLAGYTELVAGTLGGNAGAMGALALAAQELPDLALIGA